LLGFQLTVLTRLKCWVHNEALIRVVLIQSTVTVSYGSLFFGSSINFSTIVLFAHLGASGLANMNHYSKTKQKIDKFHPQPFKHICNDNLPRFVAHGPHCSRLVLGSLLPGALLPPGAVSLSFKNSTYDEMSPSVHWMNALETVTKETAGPKSTSDVRYMLFNDVKLRRNDFVLRERQSKRGDKSAPLSSSVLSHPY
jgi:hypothetical protein